ncbi:MAG: TolC family protein [Prevotella sp.]
MALRNNKQMGVARVKQDMAHNLRKSARAKFLPHVNAFGGYMYTSKEFSLLSDEQKQELGNLGTTTMTAAGQIIPSLGQMLPQESIGVLANMLNITGQGLVDALHTDTRNMFAATVQVTQPLFMGGSLIAMNKMADIAELMAENTSEAQRQLTLFNVDQAYWTVVSLKHKKKLAESFLQLVKKLDSDVGKMIREGVATRADGLKVGVKVNEAEMSLTQVENGLALSKMLLCQLCGLPVDDDVDVVDSNVEIMSDLPVPESENQDFSARPELKVLQNGIDMSRQTTNILKAGNLPKIALAGGYTVSNPSVTNSFERKLAGLWNVGVIVSVPVWNWGDVTYKVRASKNATTIATLEFNDAREKVELQVSQSRYKVDEAYKRLRMAVSNTEKAEENLRCANVGFREGVMESTAVMEAQTAWLQAQSQRIDAEIDVKLSQVALRKALGTLQE